MYGLPVYKKMVLLLADLVYTHNYTTIVLANDMQEDLENPRFVIFFFPSALSRLPILEEPAVVMDELQGHCELAIL